MYTNAGRSIKNIVAKVVTFRMVMSILIALVVVIIVGDKAGFASGCILGMIVGILGCFIDWLSGLVLYAYGDIADNLTQINEKLNEKMEYAEKTQWVCFHCGTQNFDNHGYCAQCGINRDWSKNKELEKSEKPITEKTKTITQSTMWTCSECGTKNLQNHGYCANCGVNRKWSEKKHQK